MATLEANDFLVTAKPIASAKVRLVCFPHSGGGPSAFAQWGDRLEEQLVEVVAISAPGRERRVDEPPETDWERLVGSICQALQVSGLVDGVPYVFFGHSLGALLAFETARRLDRDMVPGRPRPLHIFASGHGGPVTTKLGRKIDNWGKLHTLSDEDIMQATKTFGVLPEDLASKKDLLRAVLPALRGDFELYAKYTVDTQRRPLEMPITVLGGDNDAVAPVEQLSTWEQETLRWPQPPKVFQGGHFFLQEHLQDVIDFLLSCIEETLAALPKSLCKGVSIPSEWRCERLIVEVLQDVADRTPEALALVDPHHRLTFQDLVRQSQLLGAELRSSRYLDGATGKVIALLTPHNCNYVVGMLGIWYASGAIIVIEAHFPQNMVKEICEEAKTAAAVASPEHAPKFAEVANCRTLILDKGWVNSLGSLQSAGSGPFQKPGCQDLAILMMTSGTTGRPKTIAGSHYFMHLGALAKTIVVPLHADDCREAFNVMFVWEVLRSPLLGYTAFLLPDEAVLDPYVFINFLSKHSCTRCLTTPSLLATIMDTCAKDMTLQLGAMRSWMMCGEVLPMKTVNRFREVMTGCKLINVYSTWESGDVGFATVAPAGKYEPSKVFASAGQELCPELVAVVIDPETKQLLPKGLVGELYVGGPGLSFGYYEQLEATNSKFLDALNPEMASASQNSWKWYKTGDAARLVGEPPVLEIRGRIDSTVKIRGFKVGLPVVEAAVAKVPGVAVCAVVPVYDETAASVDSLLCIMKPQEGVDFNELVQRIKQEAVKDIPRWMMPSYYRPLPPDAMSGGESRKLNRRRLAELADLSALKESQAQHAPQPQALARPAAQELTGVRGMVRTVWAKVLSLSIDMVDPEENFFDLGGHSALAARMATELSGEYGLPLTVLDIYSNSTLQALCDFVDSKTKHLEDSAGAGPRSRLLSGSPESEAGGRAVPQIAVAGMSGKFPGADTVEAFWENLRRAAVSVTFLPKELLRGKGVPEATIGHKDFVPAAYMISDADKFDNNFFGIGRHEASLMDPQHRVFIEASWAAMENAALPPKGGLSQSVVGVFAAAGIDGYLAHHLDGRPLKDTLDPQDIFLAEIGNEKDYIATRVSYLLDFTGPSMNVNSACSSALVAVAQGAAAMASSQCDASLCGASSVTFPNLGYLYADGLVSSMDGYVRPFDAGADGTVFGDAVAAVVLRRMEDVGDAGLFYGKLRGFAVSNDGAQKAGYAAPSSAGQARALQAAMLMMKEDPWATSYVECHCTGTRIGDGIEIHGLISAFEKIGGAVQAGSTAPIALGSVKGNIAHANCAAGATGFIKVLKMMQQKTMVPTANFNELNPKINLQGLPFFVNSEVCASKTKDKIPFRAGVSSFGIGGTNAHTILEAVPAEAPAPENKKVGAGFELLTFSAKSPEALRRSAMRVAESLREEQATSAEQSPSVANVAYTLQAGRAKLPLRKALVVPSGKSQDALLKASGALEENFPEVEELEEIEDAKSRPPVAFVFPGQGSQYLSMARGLYDQVALFRSVVDDCCEKFALPKFLGQDLRPVLWGDDMSEEQKKKEFEKPTVMQPALFIVEYALARVLAAVGIKPIACGGHSLGEYAAAVVGGFLTLELAIDIVATRAKSTENLAEEGAMLSVADWSAEELEEISEGTRPGLWLAAVNSPQHAVISGEVHAIDTLEAELKAAGKKCGRLHVRRAFHSGLIAKAADTLKNIGLAEEMHGISTTPVASNLTGAWMTADHLLKGTYWTKHMRGTVLWRDNAERIIAEFRPSIVLEVGPGNTLSTLTSKCVRKEGHKPEFVQMMRHPKATGTHDVDALLSSLGKLWETGCPIDWDALHTVVLGESRPPKLLRLPTYAFDPVSLWVNPERSVYVDVTENPSPAAYIASEASAVTPAASSRMLVRYGDDRETEPAIRAYCLPFASGSSSVFAPWATEDAAVEVIAIELPGRGARSEEMMPADDAGDEALLDELCRAILADLRGAQLVLVGFSMGGGLSMELAFRLSATAQTLPLAVYVAGRKPPAGDPSLVPDINMTDSELAEYAFAPPEAAESPEFRDFVLPLLRRDLEVDARAERRLSKLGLAGRRLPSSIGVELFCGTSDTVAPWTEAPGWQRLVEAPVGIQYMPGGHEFMQEHRAMILAQWRRDALGRLVQRRSTEVALLSQGLSAPGASPALGFGLLGSLLGSQAAQQPQKQTQSLQQADALPLYAVRWQQAPSLPSRPSRELNGASQGPCLLSICGRESLAEGEFARAVEAMKAGLQICVSAAPTAGILAGPESEQEEVRLGWQFVELVQRLLDAGLGGKLLVICPASATGSAVAGASKAVAMEASELKIQRVFLPVECFADIGERLAHICGIAALYSGETDIWLRDASLEGLAFVPRLERLAEPSAKTPCIRAHAPNGELATYLLTGATGGLGKAVVSWLIQAQGLQPSQLVLLRRQGSSKLEGELAQCRVLEVAKVDCVDVLQTALGDIQNICGLFHLAGVLDDGILGGMTEERMRKVAQPKCSILTALLNCSKRLRWPLQWALGFSSTSSLFGYAGQVNYCAANAMLDQLAVFGGAGDASLVEGDRAPCRLIAVNWGPWGEAGMAQVGTKAYEQALKEGDRPLSTSTALRCLAVALRQAGQAQPGASQLCACDVEWEKSQWQDLPILEHVHDRSATSSATAREGGAEESGGGSTESSVQGFLATMAKSGGGVWSRVKGKSLHQLGLDSLELVQLRNQFNKRFSVNVPLGVVADPSQKLGELAGALLKFLDP